MTEPARSRMTHGCGAAALWALTAILVMMSPEALAQEAKPIRLFILSGQSNMARIEPAEAFTPAVTAAFPDDEVVVVKYAKNGQLVRMWWKDWQPPEGLKPKGQGRNGRHYDALMTLVNEAMQGKPAPVSVTFVWMQGESDGNHPGYGEIYPDALAGLLTQLSEDLGRDDLHFVLGRISDFGNDMAEQRPSWMRVREAQVAFAEAEPDRRAWIDTDDLNGDHNGLHLTKEGYQQLGERFAEAAIKLLRDGGD